MDPDLVLVLLICCFIGLLIWQIAWLTQKKDKVKLTLLEAASIIITIVAFLVFQVLPGEGFLPGFTWLFHAIVCCVAFLVYVIMAVITLISFKKR